MDGLRDSIIHRLGLLREQQRNLTAQARQHQEAANRAATEGLEIAGRIAELELLMSGFDQEAEPPPARPFRPELVEVEA